jgi:hypothetical protein
MRKSALWLGVIVLVIGFGFFRLVVGSGTDVRREIDAALQQLPPGYTASYGALTVDLMPRRVTISRLRLHAGGVGGFDMTVDEVAFIDPSPDFATRLAAVRDPQTAVPVSGAIELRGLTVRGPDASVQLERLRFEEVAIRPGLLRDLPIMLGFRRLEADDLAYVVDTREGEAAVRRVAVENYDAGRAGGVTIEGVTIRAEDTSVAVERMALTGVDAAAPLRRLLAGASTSWEALDGLTVARAEVMDMDAAFPDVPARLRALVLSKLAVAHGVPVSAQLSLTGLAIDRPPPSLIAMLGVRGIGSIGLDLAFDYEWEPASGRLALREAALNIEQRGRFELSLELGGVTAPVAAADPRLVAGRLRYRDDSLVERAIATYARLNGMAAGEARERLILEAQRMAMRSRDNRIATDLAASVSDFLRGPRTLSIEMKPSVPLARAEALRLLATPPDFIYALGLTITANH